MVWAAVGLGLLSLVSDVLLWFEHRRALRLKQNLVDEHTQAVADLAKLDAERVAAVQRADKAETRYDALVEKLQSKAAQRDDGIIHAKNSGDVRRIFEQQVMSQQMERDKAQEN